MKWIEIEDGKIVGFIYPKNRAEAEEFVQEIEKTCECFIANDRNGERTEIWHFADLTSFRIRYMEDRMTVEVKELGSDAYIQVF